MRLLIQFGKLLTSEHGSKISFIQTLNHQFNNVSVNIISTQREHELNNSKICIVKGLQFNA